MIGVAVLAGLGNRAAAKADTETPQDNSHDNAAVEVWEETRASSDPWRKPSPSPPAGRVLDGWSCALAAQLRVRGDFTRNQSLSNFAFTPHDDESQLLERTRPQLTLANADLGVRFFLQGQWYGRWGGDEQRSDLDLYQGYLELSRPLGLPVELKLGRQDFVYGSAFFLGANDFYNGLSWDGVRARFEPLPAVQVDLLAAKMAALNPGDPDIYLAGGYATYSPFETVTLASYVFANKGGFPFFHREFELSDSGQRWYTVGARLAGTAGALDYEIEPQFQWGHVRAAMGDDDDAVRAYGGHVDLGYTADIASHPRLFAAYGYGSGHNDIFNGIYGEFHGNVFNDNYLVGDMGVIADLSGVMVGEVHASGAHVAVAGVSANPFDGLLIGADVHRFLADQVPSGYSSDLGVEVNLVVSYQLASRVTVLVGMNRLFTGPFFAQASGSHANADYVYVQTDVLLDAR